MTDIPDTKTFKSKVPDFDNCFTVELVTTYAIRNNYTGKIERYGFNDEEEAKTYLRPGTTKNPELMLDLKHTRYKLNEYMEFYNLKNMDEVKEHLKKNADEVLKEQDHSHD